MKFYGVGAVWGGESNSVLCKFVNGELETEDPVVIKKLLAGGYRYDGDVPVPVEVVSEVDVEQITEKPITKEPIKKPVGTGAKKASTKKAVKK
jgi:hypothetical protein